MLPLTRVSPESTTILNGIGEVRSATELDDLPVLEGASERTCEVFDVSEVGDIAVVLCHFNPEAYRAPIRNLRIVLAWLARERVPTYAVELRCGASLAHHPVLPEGHDRVVQLTSHSVLFRKENLWNIGAAVLPSRYRYVLCLDADTLLLSGGWLDRLKRALAVSPVVHPFATARWTDSSRRLYRESISCGYRSASGYPGPSQEMQCASGLAIAVRRDFWTETAGFYNCPIGGGSVLMTSAAAGLPNRLEKTMRRVSMPLWEDFDRWAASVRSWCRGKLGFIDGNATHLWHGSRAKRQYWSRFDRIAGFDPRTDVTHVGRFGLLEWSPSAFVEKSAMIRNVAEYFGTRDEDELYHAS